MRSLCDLGSWIPRLLVCLALAGAVAKVLASGELPAPPPEQPPAGRGYGRGQWDDPRFVEDREDFHFLLVHRERIRRTVTRRPDGVDTLTESDDPDVAAGIRKHVHAMHARVSEGRGIHLRDPLFRAVFRHAPSVTMEVTDTDQGVRVLETSADPHVVSLIQAHADVVSAFIASGHEEVRRNHEPPSHAR